MDTYRLVVISFLSLAATIADCPVGMAAYILPGTTGSNNKLDVGYYAGGTVIELTVSGTVNLIPQTPYDWITNPDGSLFIFTDPFTYRYALAGSTIYPTAFGGDGVNHFIGGGANYDTATGTPYGHFGFAGVQTTDTTDVGTIRFGAVVYTFSNNPTRDDWFLLGYGRTISVPNGGGHLFLAVNDSNNDIPPGANSGAYSVEVTAVPEPASWILTSVGLLTLGRVD